MVSKLSLMVCQTSQTMDHRRSQDQAMSLQPLLAWAGRIPLGVRVDQAEQRDIRQRCELVEDDFAGCAVALGAEPSGQSVW